MSLADRILVGLEIHSFGQPLDVVLINDTQIQMMNFELLCKIDTKKRNFRTVHTSCRDLKGSVMRKGMAPILNRMLGKLFVHLPGVDSF